MRIVFLIYAQIFGKKTQSVLWKLGKNSKPCLFAFVKYFLIGNNIIGEVGNPFVL